MTNTYDNPLLRYDSGLFYDDSSPPPPERIRMAKVRLLLSKKSVDEKITQGNTIKNAMTGNANFATPNPTLAAFGTAITALQTKHTAYQTLVDQTKSALDDRDVAEDSYDMLATQLAAYAENITAGDAVKLQGGGFDVRGPNVPVGPLGQVQNLALMADSHGGAIKAKWAPLRGAKSYEVQVCPDPISETGWKAIEPSPRSRCTIDGLTSGAKVWVKVRGIGKGPAGAWSDPAVKIVP